MLKTFTPFILLVASAAGQSFASGPETRSAGAIPQTIPSGIIPMACKTVPANALLGCYLSDPSNSTLQARINWPFGPNMYGWKNWPAWAKNDLNIAYMNTVAWYNGGMQNYPGVLVQDPPINTNEGGILAGTSSFTTLDTNTTAWQIYIGHVALSLAAELHGWIPWSIHNYDYGALTVLFDTGFGTTNLPGVIPIQTATPGNAITTFKFLKTNDLIGATRLETIDRILTWSRWNLSHMYGDYTLTNYYAYWQYWGKPPVSRVLGGTVSQEPTAMNDAPGLRHWTQGCSGTTALFIWVFRAANIPVKQAPVGYHLAPYFVAEKLYLSHGDDPYGGYSRNLSRPIRELLINETTYQAWFPSNDVVAADKNVGRRVVELNFAYPTADLANQHLLDQYKGLSRANGGVFEYMSKVYTVAQLDAGGFWARLEALLPPVQ